MRCAYGSFQKARENKDKIPLKMSLELDSGLLRRSTLVLLGILAHVLNVERLLFKYHVTYLSSSLLVLHGEKSIKLFVCVCLNGNSMHRCSDML